MEVNKKGLRLKLVIFNIIFFVLSAVSIVMLITKPFLAINAGYVIKADTMKQAMGDAADGIDLDAVVGDGISLKLEIQITPQMLLKAWTEKDASAYVKNEIIDYNVNKIVADLEPVLNQVVNGAVKELAKTAVKEALNNKVKEAFADVTTDEGVNQKLEEAGINAAVNNIFNAFTEEGATVESLTGAIAEQANEVISNLKEMEGVDLGELPEDFDAADFKESIEGALESIGLLGNPDPVTGERPISDIESALATLMDQFLGSGDKTGDDEGSKETVAHLGYTVYAAEEENPLTAKVKELIDGYIENIPVDTIALGMKVASGVLALFILTWAWVALWCLFKSLIAKNPGIFTGFICFISGLLQIIFGLVLTYGVALILSGKINISFVADLLSNLPEGLTVAIASSATIPAFCLLAKFVLGWFYGPTKRKLKKAYKAEKNR